MFIAILQQVRVLKNHTFVKIEKVDVEYEQFLVVK